MGKDIVRDANAAKSGAIAMTNHGRQNVLGQATATRAMNALVSGLIPVLRALSDGNVSFACY